MKALIVKKRGALIATVAIALVAVVGGSVAATIILSQKTPTKQNTEVVAKRDAIKVEEAPEVASAEAAQEEQVAPVTQSTPAAEPQPAPQTPSNPYADGPLSYVYDRRVSTGKAVGTWGPSQTWSYHARQLGIAVDNTPQQYDIAIRLGLEAWFVDSVTTDSITISSKYSTDVQTKTIPMSDATNGNYLYIH